MTTQKMTRHEAIWTSAFLGVTAAAVSMEILSVTKKHPHRPAWTTFIVRHIPQPVALAAAGYLGVWLPIHLAQFYRKHGKS